MRYAYAGIGARTTPQNVLRTMTRIGFELSKMGWLLRSGHARGADQAFEQNVADDLKEIHLPWEGYNYGRSCNPRFRVPELDPAIHEIAARNHPAWNKLTPEVQLFMYRNVTIILGEGLLNPAKMVICWTPDGKITGGTGHGIRVAQMFDIPVFNLADLDQLASMVEFVNALPPMETADVSTNHVQQAS